MLFLRGYLSERLKSTTSEDAMLARLLESKSDGDRSVWGAAVSTIVHTAVIGAAVFATAQARVDQPRQVEVVRCPDSPDSATIS